MIKRLLFVVNDSGFFLSHRLPIATGAAAAGYEVHVATGPGPAAAAAAIAAKGFVYHQLPLSRRGTNFFAEAGAFLTLVQLFARLRPDIVHLVTIKAVLYGGVAARICRVPAVLAAVSGLGAVFIAKGNRAGLLRKAVDFVYRSAFRHPCIRVVFQNEDDRSRFVQSGAVVSSATMIIRGSGVDLDEYPFQPEPPPPLVVSMVSRLLRDKGVHEFVEACSALKVKYPDSVFRLVGDIDDGNPATLTETDLELIKAQGDVALLGHRRDIAALLSASHVVVLPSHREGLPKVLIEAAACGRAVVTTDVPGCRDAIEPDQSGLLVPLENAPALASAIGRLLSDEEKRRAMGKEGRALAERAFRVQSVVEAHLAAYRELLSAANKNPD